MAPLLGSAAFLVRGATSLLESEPPQALMASRAVAVRARAEMRGEVFMAVFIALLKPRFNSGGLCLTEIHFSTSRLFGGFFLLRGLLRHSCRSRLGFSCNFRSNSAVRRGWLSQCFSRSCCCEYRCRSCFLNCCCLRNHW